MCSKIRISLFVFLLLSLPLFAQSETEPLQIPAASAQDSAFVASDIFLGIKIYYEDFTPEEAAVFKSAYTRKVYYVVCLINSLNHFVEKKITAVHIYENAMPNVSAFWLHRLKITSGVFQIKNPRAVRSIFYHEIGHVIFNNDLPQKEKDAFEKIFHNLKKDRKAIMAFREGRYLWDSQKDEKSDSLLSLIGHPQDSPSELFASALALSLILDDKTLRKLDKNVLKFLQPFAEKIKEIPQNFCGEW